MTENYDLTCILCGTLVGQRFDGRLVLRAAVSKASSSVGQVRCARCGGSVYVEATDANASSLDSSVRIAQAEAERQKQAQVTLLGSPTTSGADARDGVAAPGAA
jgi:hypothetical protein